MLSWLILTGRRFIHEEERQRSKKEWRLCRSVIQFSGNIPWRSGDYSAVVIPVPIPNTEVKHCRGKNSLMVNRARCRVIRKNAYVLPFFGLFNLLFSSCSRRRPIIYRWKGLSVDMTIYYNYHMLKLIPHGINMVQYEAFKLINGETMQQNSLDYQVMFPLYLYVWILFKELYFSLPAILRT